MNIWLFFCLRKPVSTVSEAVAVWAVKHHIGLDLLLLKWKTQPRIALFLTPHPLEPLHCEEQVEAMSPVGPSLLSTLVLPTLQHHYLLTGKTDSLSVWKYWLFFSLSIFSILWDDFEGIIELYIISSWKGFIRITQSNSDNWWSQDSDT